MLIKTKLQPPPLRSGLLYRKHLIQRLGAAGEYSFVLISGPAGSGKTSLICQWIKKERLKIAWYSLDEEDNEPDLFFRYLLTTLVRMDERLDNAFGPVLTKQRALGEENVIPLVIESLSALSDNIYLVLDDFHNLTNGKIHTALAHLIKYIPDHLNLVIISRYNLPGPIGAVALKKERLEILSSDLKFTEKESGDFFKDVIPLSFSSGQIHALNQYVEGWAAGLQLIGLSVRSKGRVTDLSYIINQAHEQVTGFLIHDILRMQSEKVRKFVFATVLLDRFNPELCAEVIGMPEALSILASLTRMNLFLIPLETDRKWYRYHHMFSEAVRRQVEMDAPDLVLETLRRAAKWFAKNNCLEDALRSAFRSKDFEFAADLMENYIHRYMDQYELMAGLRWILRLPCSVLNQRGLLRLRQCGFLLLLMEYVEVKDILSDLERNDFSAFKRYSGRKREFCEAYWAQFKFMIQIFYAENLVDVTQLTDCKNKLSAKNPLLSGALEMLLVFVLISKGEFAPAEQSLAKYSELTDGCKYMRQKFYLAKAKALIARHRGRLYKAETILNQALEFLNNKGKGGIPTAFLLHRHLAYIFYLQNKLEKAREYAAVVFRHIEHDELFDEINSTYDLQFLLHLAAGETEQATLRIREIKALSVKLEQPLMAAGARVNDVRLAIYKGNLMSAERWSQQRKLQVDEPFSLLFAVECLTLARLFYAHGKYPDAVNILEVLRRRCQKRGLKEFVLQIDILRAAGMYALDRCEAAISLLRQALIFSETEGYVRPFVNDAGIIAPLLRNIAETLSPAAFTSHYKTVLTACEIVFDPPAGWHEHDTGTYGVLTPREIEILAWMAKGAKNNEIACHAYIALSTVKTHVSSILSKLGVKTRTQAILKAKEMNLYGMVD